MKPLSGIAVFEGNDRSLNPDFLRTDGKKKQAAFNGSACLNQIPLVEKNYNAPSCLRNFSELALTFAGGFMLRHFLKFAIAFFLSPFVA
jgi:hypothetical protein